MKKCCTCKIVKLLSCFYRSSYTEDGYKRMCKKCHSLSAHAFRNKQADWKKEYRKKRFQIGHYLDNTWWHMKQRVEGRNPTKTSAEGQSLLDIREFKIWSRSNDRFLLLFKNFVESGFQRRLAPSIDRINIKIGYELGNIQWLTTSDNRKKYDLIDKFNKLVKLGETDN